MRKAGVTRGSSQTEEPENPYWISFSDIMAGLLVVFILALVTLMIRIEDQRSDVENALRELAAIEQIRKDLLKEIKIELKKNKIDVIVSDDNKVLRIPDDQFFFESGSHKIPLSQRKKLDLIGSILKNAITKANRNNFIDTIFIEGHTDSLSFKRGEMGNWGLSTYRAISVWKYWTEKPGKLKIFSKLKNITGDPLFSVSGYADTRHVIKAERTKTDRRKNRRIDVRFNMRTPETGDLKEIMKLYK